MRQSAVALLLLVSAHLHAAPALERGADDTIKWRGQGPNPWSFAFAEEQLIKDQNCLPKGCPANGNQWTVSIFDLVKTHAQTNAVKINLLLDKQGQNLKGAKSLFTGSVTSLPFESVNSLRASKCTLEQPVLRMNRSFSLNPNRLNLYDHLSNMHKKIKAEGVAGVYDVDQKVELKSLQIQALMPHLETLAKASPDADTFVSKVIEFTSCADQVQIPKLEAIKKINTNEASIRAELSEILKLKKPVLLGVCSEVLEDDKTSATCSGHNVVAKDIKANKVLINDSAFFSTEKRNADGSAWISLESLVKAVGRYGAALEKSRRESTDGVAQAQSEFDTTMARLKRELDESLAGLNNESANFAATVKETLDRLRKGLARVPPAKFRQAVINELSKVNEGDEDDLDETFIDEVEKLELRTVADLNLIEPLLMASLQRGLQEALEQMRATGTGESHLPWPSLDSSHNMVWFK